MTMTEWQPIETIPRGEWVRVWTPSLGTTAGFVGIRKDGKSMLSKYTLIWIAENGGMQPGVGWEQLVNAGGKIEPAFAGGKWAPLGEPE